MDRALRCLLPLAWLPVAGAHPTLQPNHYPCEGEPMRVVDGALETGGICGMDRSFGSMQAMDDVPAPMDDGFPL